ncbi:MAG TPA: hypothetical protein VME66_00755 [Candidatus Acidoferrales bacterium]|nr:hypothetical protein [Candidatus Acidoferrales bacterium]
MRARCLLALGFTLVLAGVSAAAARADQFYRVSGKDSFSVGASNLRGDIAYDGIETLSIQPSAGATRYAAHVRYIRIDQGARSDARATVTAVLLPSGEQIDSSDDDPDYLAVLNQPFAVQLDAATLRALDHLRGSVPFTFPSPMTGSTLQGTLRHLGDAPVDSERAVGILFTARGPLRGSLPGRPSTALSGTITMNGTAYYDQRTALLCALDATMVVTGTIHSPDGSLQPLSVTYRRTLRKTTPTPTAEAHR